MCHIWDKSGIIDAVALRIDAPKLEISLEMVLP